MILADVMEELVAAVKPVPGVRRVFGYPPKTLVPPAAYVSYPEQVDYDATYGGGMDRMPRVPVTAVAAQVTDRTARDLASAWSDPTNPDSIKARLEAYPYTACDFVHVEAVSFQIETIADVPYLAAVFVCAVAGDGSA